MINKFQQQLGQRSRVCVASITFGGGTALIWPSSRRYIVQRGIVVSLIDLCLCPLRCGGVPLLV